MATLNEWKVDASTDRCDCSQQIKLEPTGYSDSQAPSKYCPICRIGFWLVEIKPSLNQLTQARSKYNNIAIKESDMSYTALRREPLPTWNSNTKLRAENVKNKMIDQLGKLLPWWLTDKQKAYWAKKYDERYPNSDIAKKRKENKVRV